MAFPGLAALAPLAAAGGGALLSKLASGQGGVGNFLGGTPAKEQRFDRFNPQQQEAFSSLLQQIMPLLGGLTKGNQFDFGPIEQQARSGFMQNTVPTLAERFTSLGSGSALSSPAFISQLGQAGAGLEEGLAAQKAGIGMQQGQQQQQLLMSLLGLGLTPQFESAYQPRQPGFLESGAQGLLASLPLLGLLR